MKQRRKFGIGPSSRHGRICVHLAIWLLIGLPVVAPAAVVASEGPQPGASAAPGVKATAAARQAIESLPIEPGRWEGEGWIQLGPDRRATFRQTEVVETLLEGTMLLIEGTGVSEIGGREVPTHHAIGLVSATGEEGRYDFYAKALGRGPAASHEAWLTEDGAFVWQAQNDRGTARFTIRRDDDGRWHEIGERSRDGESWMKFFEMTLRRVGDSPS